MARKKDQAVETLERALAARTTEGARGALWEPLGQGIVRCVACGHRCSIPDGHDGVCRVRFNRDGVLRVPVGLRRRAAGRPDREEAVLPRRSPARGALLRDARLRLPVPLLPELGDLARRCAIRATRSPSRVRRAPKSSSSWPSRQARRMVTSTYNEPLITSGVGGRRLPPGARRRAHDELRLERKRNAGSPRLPASLDRRSTRST